MTLRLRQLLGAFVAVVLLTAAVTAPAFEFVSLGTGAITGLYYPTGRAICSLANHEDAGGAVRCSVEPTSGLVYNVDHLATGDLDFALIQSDVQFDAYTGRGPWAARPMPELRSVFTVFTEAVAIVARADLDVTGLDSLKGMRLSVGNPGSGARATWEKIGRRSAGSARTCACGRLAPGGERRCAVP